MASRRRRTGGLVDDFKQFALKGNVLDLAVAVIIGGAFGKIVTSFVGDIVMPFINPLVSAAGKDWRTYEIGPGIKIGSFLGSVFDFLIIALILFIAIQAIQKFKREEATIEDPIDPKVQAEERLTSALERLTQTIESRN